MDARPIRAFCVWLMGIAWCDSAYAVNCSEYDQLRKFSAANFVAIRGERQRSEYKFATKFSLPGGDCVIEHQEDSGFAKYKCEWALDNERDSRKAKEIYNRALADAVSCMQHPESAKQEQIDQDGKPRTYSTSMDDLANTSITLDLDYYSRWWVMTLSYTVRK